MCGIVVGLTFGKLNKEKEEMRQKLLKYFTTELLIVTEDRGKDATGAAVLFDDGRYVGIKRGEQASAFLAKFGRSNEYYGGFLKIWDNHKAPVRVFLGHCRAGTIGAKENNANNHPIKIGNLVGIHNGGIKNHEIIFKNLGCKRDGEVDSEAIFRLFEYYTNKGKEPFTMEMLQNIVDRLQGQFAVTLFNADNPYQVPIFRDGRPVEFVLLRKYGILLMVSEIKFWNYVFYNYERLVHYYNTFYNSNLPSFLDDKDVEVEKMPDDTAYIFDLTKEINENTEIKDLAEIQKMVRTNKIWTVNTNDGYYGSSGYYGNIYTNRHSNNTTWSSSHVAVGYNRKTETNEKNNTDKQEDSTITGNVKKRRVFDKITNKYKVSIGDKDAKPKEAITLPVDEEVTSKKVEVIDKTNYNKEDNDKEDVVDVVDFETIEEEAEIVEVNMNTYPPDVVESAKEAYNKLPASSKGFKDSDDMLSSLDMDGIKDANNVIPLLLGNRAHKHGWLQGYMYAMMKLKSKKDEKDIRRQKYIGALKGLVLILSKFYKESKESASPIYETDNIIKSRLLKSINDENIEVDIDTISKLFNTSKVELLNDVKDILSKNATE